MYMHAHCLWESTTTEGIGLLTTWLGLGSFPLRHRMCLEKYACLSFCPCKFHASYFIAPCNGAYNMFRLLLDGSKETHLLNYGIS